MRFLIVAEGVVPDAYAHAVARVSRRVVGRPVGHHPLAVLASGLLQSDPLRLDPVKIRRIDVGRQPHPEPVQLVRTDEVHLAGQHGIVTRAGQIVGKGRLVGGQQCAVVPCADFRCMPSRHQAGPAGRAEGKRGVGGVVPHAGFHHAVQVGGPHDGMTIGSGQCGDHLVGKDKEDVGLVGHGTPGGLGKLSGGPFTSAYRCRRPPRRAVGPASN